MVKNIFAVSILLLIATTLVNCAPPVAKVVHSDQIRVTKVIANSDGSYTCEWTVDNVTLTKETIYELEVK